MDSEKQKQNHNQLTVRVLEGEVLEPVKTNRAVRTEVKKRNTTSKRYDQKFINSIVAKGLIGTWHDGDGVYIRRAETKAGGVSVSYLFRYNFAKKPRTAGLGRAKHVTLEDARIEAEEMRAQVRKRIDPVRALSPASRRMCWAFRGSLPSKY
jgi:Arm DNA-binding domain